FRVAINRRGRREDEMAHASLDGSLDQSARVHGIVVIIAERIANRVGHHDRGGEMDDGLDAMLGYQVRHERLVPGVTDDKLGALCYRPIGTGTEVVGDQEGVDGKQDRFYHVTADV